MGKRVNELETVKDFFVWRNNPGKNVEKLNIKKTKYLGWKNTDVLYSFLGIYAIGVWVYNKEKFRNTDYMIFCKNSQQRIYSEKFLREIQTSTDYELNELNKQSEKLLRIYSLLGNVIPMWPGGNVAKGKANNGCFDIPERYFNLYYDWFLALRRIYKTNIFLDGIINMGTPKQNKYKDLTMFLESVNTPEKYIKFIDDICHNIETRNDKLNYWINEKSKEITL